MLRTKANFKGMRGFTLIELILSLSLVGVVLTTAFTLYSTGQKVYQRENDQLYAQHNVRQAFLWLSTSIKQAKDVKVISKDKIRTLTCDNEEIMYYFKKGVLYREKNKGVNPVAHLNQVGFTQSPDESCIGIYLLAEANGSSVKINTKVVPFGFLIY